MPVIPPKAGIQPLDSASEIKAACANQRKHRPVRGVPGNRYPYRDHYAVSLAKVSGALH